MQAELFGAQDQIAFKRQLLFSFSCCSCSVCAILCLPLAQLFFSSPPQDLDKYSFYLFLIFEDSLHLFLMALISSCFDVSITSHISPDSFFPPSVSCCHFVFLLLCHQITCRLSLSFLSAVLPPLMCLPCLFLSSTHPHLSLIHSFMSNMVCPQSYCVYPFSCV